MARRLGLALCVTLLASLALASPALAGNVVNFAAPSSITLPINPSSVAVGDFNADGDPDLAVANDASSNVSILVGGMGGSFSGPTNIAVPGGATSVAVGSFNADQDADLDLAVVGTRGTVSVFLGSVGSTFTTGTTLTAGDFPVDVAVGDFNGDADPELAVANQGSDNVSIFTADAAARFIPTATVVSAGDGPNSIAVGNFDAGGDPDLAVTNQVADNGSILTGTGATTVGFTGPVNFTVGDFPQEVATGDFDGDGDPDLAVANQGSSTVSVLTGGAGTSFVASSTLTGGARAVSIGDFNLDGDRDLAVGGNSGNNLSIFVGGAGASFGAAQVFAAGAEVESVGVDDFNADSKPDVAVANYFKAMETTLLNTTDLTPPDTTITTGSTGPTNDSTPQFAFSATEPATFECRVVGVTAFASCSSPHTTAALADGARTFEVRATDTAGNVETTPAARSFTVDTAPPDTTITTGPSDPTTDDTPTFEFNSSEPGSTFECRVDSSAFASCTSPHTTAALTTGARTFEVRATDAAGNVDGTAASRAFTVSPPARPDTTPPDTTITAGPSGSTGDRTPTFEFTSNEPGSTFQCKVDSSPFIPCSSPITLPELSLGPHTFQVRAIDAAGNVDESPASATDVQAALRNFTIVAVAPGRPVLGRKFNVEPVAGEVLVSVAPGTAAARARGDARASVTVPGVKGRNFVPLREARQIAVGSILDTRKGTVRLTSARDSGGRPQAGRFDGGVFQVLQSRKRSAKGLTELRLKGSSFAGCGGRSSTREASTAARSRRRIRRLRGNGRGRFQTRGRYSAATVRGTVWTVTDRCDGTLTKVTRGKVTVRDFRRRKNVLLRAGKSYFARAPR